MSLVRASPQWSTVSSKDLKIRFESLFARMNCQTFSCGFSSARLAGNRIRVMLGGTVCRPERLWPARSAGSTAWAPSATWAAISARCRLIASVSQPGITSAAPLPCLGRIAPKIEAEGSSLVFGSARTRSLLGLAASHLVLLADPRLVGEPDLHGVGSDALLAPDHFPDLFQVHGEAFLKSSIGPSICA